LPNYVTALSPYSVATSLAELDWAAKRVLLIGAGAMGREFLKTFRAMGISRVAAVTTIEESASALQVEFGVEVRVGTADEALRDDEVFDLVVIAVPIESLLDVARQALSRGHRNIMIEKPGALCSAALDRFAREVGPMKARIRVGYNRTVYPNLLLLEQLVAAEGGITSCRYTFTEWIDRIDFSKNGTQVYERWGISNSLHVISMAHRLIGTPTELSTHRQGRLDWHTSGSRFSGSGFSQTGAVFAYDADWESAGRWTVEVRTRANAYRLIPLEALEVCARESVTWSPVHFKAAYPPAKAGLAEEVAVMLDASLEQAIPLPTLAAGVSLLRIAEQIFGYDSETPDAAPGAS
jgi:predicted dehydrogenase